MSTLQKTNNDNRDKAQRNEESQDLLIGQNNLERDESKDLDVEDELVTDELFNTQHSDVTP